MKLLSVLTCLLLFACHNKNNNTNTHNVANPSTAFTIRNVAGVFYDTLPCADCPGIATKLHLKPDNSFIMEQSYIGKSIVYNLGRWSITDSIIKLTGTEGISQFK